MNIPRYVVLLKPGEKPELIESSKPTLEQLQEWIGGFIEPIYIGDSLVMLVDEDGRLKNLTHNGFASVIAGRLLFGPAIIVLQNKAEMVGMPKEKAEWYIGV